MKRPLSHTYHVRRQKAIPLTSMGEVTDCGDCRVSRPARISHHGVPLLGTSSAGQPGYARHCFCEAVAHCRTISPRGEKCGLAGGFARRVVRNPDAAGKPPAKHLSHFGRRESSPPLRVGCPVRYLDKWVRSQGYWMGADGATPRRLIIPPFPTYQTVQRSSVVLSRPSARSPNMTTQLTPILCSACCSWAYRFRRSLHGASERRSARKLEVIPQPQQVKMGGDGFAPTKAATFACRIRRPIDLPPNCSAMRARRPTASIARS